MLAVSDKERDLLTRLPRRPGLHAPARARTSSDPRTRSTSAAAWSSSATSATSPTARRWSTCAATSCPCSDPRLLDRHPLTVLGNWLEHARLAVDPATPGRQPGGLGAVGPALPAPRPAGGRAAAPRRRREGQGGAVDDGLHAGRHHPDRRRGARPGPGRARPHRLGRRRPRGRHHPPADRRRPLAPPGPPGRRPRRRPPPARGGRPAVPRDRRAGDGPSGPPATATRADRWATVGRRPSGRWRTASARSPRPATSCWCPSSGDGAVPDLAPQRAWPFPEARDGESGYEPVDGAAAVNHLEAQRQRGARWFALPSCGLELAPPLPRAAGSPRDPPPAAAPRRAPRALRPRRAPPATLEEPLPRAPRCTCWARTPRAGPDPSPTLLAALAGPRWVDRHPVVAVGCRAGLVDRPTTPRTPTTW